MQAIMRSIFRWTSGVIVTAIGFRTVVALVMGEFE